MYSGIYHGKKKHQPDIDRVLKRAFTGTPTSPGLEHVIITTCDLKSAQKNLALHKQFQEAYPEKLSLTIGVHPTQCNAFDTYPKGPEAYMTALHDFAIQNKEHITAYGEFGLDYDRLFFCPKETQLKYFEQQFDLVKELDLPLFLHCRAAEEDFTQILAKHRSSFKHGVVHSFTGSMEEMQRYVDMGLYIGVNGCSLKTPENCAVVKAIPLDRLMLETDAPWCEIRTTHASFQHVKTKFKSMKPEDHHENATVRGRNEPHLMIQVLEAVSGLRGETTQVVADAVYDNTVSVFSAIK